MEKSEIKAMQAPKLTTWGQLEKFWKSNGGKVKAGVLTAITATFLSTSMASCDSKEKKLNGARAELEVLTENFYKTREDAKASIKAYDDAKARGDKISATTQKKQAEFLKEETIKKIKRIEELKEKSTKLTAKIRKNEEKSAGEGKSISWEDALNYTP